MEKKMETTVVYWGYIGGLYRDNGKENGHYYSILGLYRDNGKENGDYYIIIGYILGLYWGYMYYMLGPRSSHVEIASGLRYILCTYMGLLA